MDRDGLSERSGQVGGGVGGREGLDRRALNVEHRGGKATSSLDFIPAAKEREFVGNRNLQKALLRGDRAGGGRCGSEEGAHGSGRVLARTWGNAGPKCPLDAATDATF